MSEECTPAPLDTGSPSASSARADEIRNTASKLHQGSHYTPVPWADPTAVAAVGAENLVARQRRERLEELDYRLKTEERLTRLARLRAKRIMLWLGVLTAIAAVIHAIAEGILESFYPVSDVEMAVSNATYFVGGAFTYIGLYLSGRFGKSQPSPDLPDEAATLLDAAGKLTRLSDDS
jgi:hypothetical protein